MDHNYTKYRELQNNDVVLILGAYCGDFCREMKDEIIKKSVYVVNIEPMQQMAVECSAWIYENMRQNACCLNMAIWNKSGLVSFCNNDVEGASVIDGIRNQYDRPTLFKNRVMSLTLDQLLSVQHFDCIFSDIEGAELEVFTESKLVNSVPYIAIASYHVRPECNGKTARPIAEHFRKSRNVTVDFPDEMTMVYVQ